jgi:hypothetical protein
MPGYIYVSTSIHSIPVLRNRTITRSNYTTSNTFLQYQKSTSDSRKFNGSMGQIKCIYSAGETTSHNTM